jgi:3-isopropylmalate dehydrogenase
MKKKIAVLAGDGIGPEVMEQTLRVLDCVANKFKHQFEILTAKIGGDAYDAYGTHCPSQTLNQCESADCILFGSVGGPINQQQEPKWHQCETNSILKLRQHFKLGTNIRPITVYPALVEKSPLKYDKNSLPVDFIIFRELTGGSYFGEQQITGSKGQRLASDQAVYREQQIWSIAQAAFKTAQARKKRVCSVDKANVLATSKLWREVVNEVGEEYPDVELTHMLIDNCAMQMVIKPQQFDIILTENLFGDILSDLAAALPGSLGLVPSASLNETGFGLYEPSGGSAPDIAGKNIANPIAQILSAALMLRHSFNLEQEARLIESSVQAVLSNGIYTQDVAIKPNMAVSTTEFVDEMIRFVGR